MAFRTLMVSAWRRKSLAMKASRLSVRDGAGRSPRLGWRLGALLLAIWIAPLAHGAPAWKIQFFYDVLDARFTIMDMGFFSAKRGVAVGYVDVNGKIKPYSVATSDGGQTWTPVKIKDPGVSLFVLNDTVAWMVTQKSLWKTEEAGRSWRRLVKEKDMIRVYFLDENRGWAVGREKSIWETTDGGKNWSLLPVAAEPKTTKEYTSYIWIEFANQRQGAIVGVSEPPRPGGSRFPTWMDPERAEREWPTSTIVVQTLDGGRSWKQSTISMFGSMVRLRMRPDGRGLALVRFQRSFEWPSEVYRINLKQNETTRTFREKDRSITDLILAEDNFSYLAGYEQVGTLPDNPVPGRVVILRSLDLQTWEEMEVDYRANAKRVVLAAAGGDIWAGTDTGMILKLARD